MTKISIIMPVYNVGRYLKQALNSILNQTLADIEIICVNDCSTDNSLELLEEFAKKDSRIKIINQEINKGKGAARNLALNLAKGNYVMFLDADDWYELNACELAYEQIKNHNNDIVFFNYSRFNNETKINKTAKNYQKKLSELTDSYDLNIYNSDIPFNAFAWSKIYNRNFLIENNCLFLETRNSEDVIFAVKTTIAAKSISVLNKPLYIYRIFALNDDYKKNIHKQRASSFTDPIVGIRESFNLLTEVPNDNLFKKHYILFYLKALQEHFINFSALNLKSAKYYFLEMKKFLRYININKLDCLLKHLDYYQVLVLKLSKSWFVYYFLLLILPKALYVHIYRKNYYEKRASANLFGLKCTINYKKEANQDEIVYLYANPAVSYFLKYAK